MRFVFLIAILGALVAGCQRNTSTDVDVGGDVARRNGNPAQCANVAC